MVGGRGMIIRTFLFVLLMCSPCLSEEKYITGLEVASVPDFKKSWKESGREPLKFPPRSDTAVVVAEVLELSPAHSAGLQKFDIIRVVNGEFIKEPSKFYSYIGDIGTNAIRLTVTRRSSNRWRSKSILIKPLKESEFYKRAITKNEHDKNMMHHAMSNVAPNNPNGFDLFYVTVGKQNKLYLRITHRARSWLFIDSYTITTDKKLYTLKPREMNTKATSFMGVPEVWEWCDYPIKASEHEMIKDIVKDRKSTRLNSSHRCNSYAVFFLKKKKNKKKERDSSLPTQTMYFKTACLSS